MLLSERERFLVTSKLVVPNGWITQILGQRIPDCWIGRIEDTKSNRVATNTWYSQSTDSGRSQITATVNVGDLTGTQ